MIVYARTKEVVIKGKDSNDNEQYLRVSGEGQDALVFENPLTIEAKIKDPSSSDMEVSLVSENEEKTDKKKQPKKVTEKKSHKLSKKQLKETITENHIYKYMEQAGTKNKKIQEIIYEQASAAAKDSTPFEILRQVVKILNTQKGGL